MTAYSIMFALCMQYVCSTYMMQIVSCNHAARKLTMQPARARALELANFEGDVTFSLQLLQCALHIQYAIQESSLPMWTFHFMNTHSIALPNYKTLPFCGKTEKTFFKNQIIHFSQHDLGTIFRILWR